MDRLNIGAALSNPFHTPNIDQRKVFKSIPGPQFTDEYVDELERALIMCKEYPSMAKEVAEGVIDRWDMIQRRGNAQILDNA